MTIIKKENGEVLIPVLHKEPCAGPDSFCKQGGSGASGVEYYDIKKSFSIKYIKHKMLQVLLVPFVLALIGIDKINF